MKMNLISRFQNLHAVCLVTAFSLVLILPTIPPCDSLRLGGFNNVLGRATASHPHFPLVRPLLFASLLSADGSSSSSGDSGGSEERFTEEDIRSKEQDAISAVQTCYKTVLCAAAAEILTAGWVVREAPRAYRILTLLGVLWKIGFSSGLFRLSQAMMMDPILDDVNQELLRSRVDKLYRVMSHVWRNTALLITIGSIVDLASRFREGIPMIPRSVTVLAVAVATIVGMFSLKQTDSLVKQSDTGEGDTAANGGLTVHQKVTILARNMALCVAALFVRGAVVTPLLAVGGTSLKEKIHELINMYTPLLGSRLLWNLRRDSLEVYRSIITNEWTPLIQVHSLESQKKFYTNTANNFRKEVVLKILVVLVVPLVKSLVKIMATKSSQ